MLSWKSISALWYTHTNHRCWRFWSLNLFKPFHKSSQSRGIVCLTFLFMLTERIIFLFVLHTWNSQQYLNRRDLDLQEYMQHIFSLTLPVKMVVLCLKVSSAGYYWCQGCNTLQQEADHTVKSFGKRAQLRYYLWGLAPCMKFCSMLFRYSGWSAYCSIHRYILLYREAIMPAAGVIVCVGHFTFACFFQYHAQDGRG